MEKQDHPLELSEETIVLNEQDSKRFHELMESPPEPNEALKRARARYRALNSPAV